MSENHECSVLHVGKVDFPIPWEDWKSILESNLNWRFKIDSVDEIHGGMDQFKSYRVTRLSRQWATAAYSLFKANAPVIHHVHYIDCIWNNGGILWPQLIHKDAIHSVILERQPYLNIKGAGLIVGMSQESILAAFVLVELGIKQITFVTEDEEASESVITLLKQSMFEVAFEVITSDKVILLPGIYSVIICYEDLRERADLLTSLLYFNYLERGGLVVNAGTILEKVPLMEEALAIGAKVVDISEVQIHEEMMALRKVMPLGQQVQQKLLQSVRLNLK